VYRIDPLRRVGRAIEVSGAPVDVTVGRDGVWVTSADGILTRIDPGTHQTTTIDVSEAAALPMGITADDRGVVYVTALDCQICPGNSEASLVRVDPSSGSIATVPVPNYYPASSVLAVGGSLWMTAGAELWRVEAASGKVMRKVRIEEQLGDLATDPNGASIWVTTVSAGGRVGRVIQIDTATGEVIGGQPIGCCPGAIALGEGYVWVTNSVDGTIERISLVTGDVAPPITVGKGVNGIAVGQGGVWVTIDR
jgi:streptogramin lyase